MCVCVCVRHAGSLFVAMRTINCGLWDLALLPGIEPRPPALWAQSLGHWTTGKSSSPWCFKMLIYLFIFGCAASSSLLAVWAFSSCGEPGLVCSRDSCASHCSGFPCWAQVLGQERFRGCCAPAQGLQGTGLAAHLLLVSSQVRDQTCFPCTARGTPDHWTTMDACPRWAYGLAPSDHPLILFPEWSLWLYWTVQLLHARSVAVCIPRPHLANFSLYFKTLRQN